MMIAQACGVAVRLVVTALAVGAGVVSVAACDAGSDGHPPRGEGVAQDSTSPIPPVRNPRDVGVFAQRTCELLTPRQTSDLGFPHQPEQRDAILDTTTCTWTASDSIGLTVRSLTVGLFTNNPTLEAAYRKRDSWPFFELTAVDGYPATVTRSNIDLPTCSIDVRTAERQNFTLAYNAEDLKSAPQRSCDVAKQVASAVLANLPPKG